MARRLLPLLLLTGCFNFSTPGGEDAGVDAGVDAGGADLSTVVAMPVFKTLSQSTTENGDQTTLTVPRPTPLDAGDLMIMGAYIDDTGGLNPIITAPSEWTPVALHFDTFSSYNCGWYWRVAQASESASWQFTIAPGRRVEAAIAVYSGARAAMPFDPTPMVEYHGNATVAASPITTVDPQTRVVWVFVADHLAASTIDWRTPPTGTIKRINFGHIGIFDAPMAAPGPSLAFQSADATNVIGLEVVTFAVVP